jgi:hypothetical protein
MNLKSALSVIIVSALLVLPLNVVQCTNSVDATPFAFREIDAAIRIRSPVNNTTYNESAILLNITLYLSGTEWVPESHVIPYREISCIYSLDNGEWKNASLASTTENRVWQSWVNKWWFNQMQSTYTAVLQDLPEGLHFIRVAIRPSGIRSYNYHDIDDLEPSVNFTISKQSPNSTMSTQQPELIYAVAVGAVIIAAIAVIAVVLKGKRR